MSTATLHLLVQAAIDRDHITAKAIACDPELADTAAFCEHYGYKLDQSANTIIVASRPEPTAEANGLMLR